MELPFARVSPSVDVQHFTRDGGGLGQIDDSGCNVTDARNQSHRGQAFQEILVVALVHRSLDDARRNRVHTNPILRVFDGQAARDRLEPAFGDQPELDGE